MQQGLFRQVALERLSSPDQLDRLMQITDPKGWVALLALLGLTLAMVLWGIFGSVATNVGGQGVLVREGGAYRVYADAPGQIASVAVKRGDLISEGQVIAVLQPRGAAPTEITSPAAVRVLELTVEVGTFVNAGTPIMEFDFPERPLVAVLYLSSSVGQQVQPGMPVQLSPLAVKREEFGFMLGRVKSVAQFPSTELGMLAVLPNESLVRQLYAASDGSPLEILVEVERDETPSGFKWSSSQGPPISIRAGMLCTAEVTLSEQRPISLALPIFR
jgi:hypothetical protein